MTLDMVLMKKRREAIMRPLETIMKPLPAIMKLQQATMKPELGIIRMAMENKILLK